MCLKNFVATGVGMADNRASSLRSTSSRRVDISSELCVQPGSRSRVERSGVLIPAGTRDIFLQKSIQTLGPTQPSVQMAPRFFPGFRSAGA